jgi:hypothetical protein
MIAILYVVAVRGWNLKRENDEEDERVAMGKEEDGGKE